MARYYIRTGTLYREEDKRPAAVLKGAPAGPKRVFLPDGSLALRISHRGREYILWRPDGTEMAVASPAYALGEDPHGQYAYRMPRMDRAYIRWEDREYILTLERGGHYRLWDSDRELLVRFTRRGWGFGWSVEAPDTFDQPLLCGVFAFCQYLGFENEFMAV